MGRHCCVKIMFECLQIVIVPIWKNDEEKEKVLAAAISIENRLKSESIGTEDPWLEVQFLGDEGIFIVKLLNFDLYIKLNPVIW